MNTHIIITKDQLDSDNNYVGVSGVGISELGSHSTGKIIARDER